MRVKRKFKYEGIELRIVEMEEPYMNAGNVTVTRVIAPNGGKIPIQIRHKQTLKSIAEVTISTLDGFKKRGADVVEELTRDLGLIS